MAKMRAYFKLDLYFFEHPKVVDLSAEAIVLYIASIAYCNRRETDGFIARPVVRRLIDVDEQEGRTAWEIADELVKAGLWEEARPGFVQTDTKPRPPDGPDGFWIHDFLEHNESNEERAQRREHDAARKRRERGSDTKGAGHTPNSSRPGNVQSDTTGRPSGQDAASEPVPPIAVAVTEQSSNRKKINTVVEQARPLAVIPGGFSDDPADILDVWETWKTSTGHQRAEFSPIRRQAIAKALDKYPVQDVLDAVQGHVYDPWPERPQHNDITQLLHMGTKRKPHNTLEKMRDLWRDGPPSVMGRHTREMADYARQMAAMNPAKGVAAGGLEANDGHRALAQRQLPGPED